MTQKRNIVSGFLKDQAPQMQSLLIAVLFVFAFIILLGVVVIAVRFLFGLV